MDRELVRRSKGGEVREEEFVLLWLVHGGFSNLY
tara:strand:+ start:529 stop:630 length:102 start_codon:yes stop_codon:yes gene_type:complete